jgi:hypothetical protein
VTYIASPTGAGGQTLEERLARVDALSEAEAKIILKRCIDIATRAKDEAVPHLNLNVAVDGFHP